MYFNDKVFNIHYTTYRSRKSTADELRFTLCRKEFKRLMKAEMRDNLYCSNDIDSNDICKQLCSHDKTKSSTSPTTFLWNKLSCDIRAISNTHASKTQFLWLTGNTQSNIEIY